MEQGQKLKNQAPSCDIGIGSWSSKPNSWQASSFRSNQNVLKPQGRKKQEGKKRHGVEEEQWENKEKANMKVG